MAGTRNQSKLENSQTHGNYTKISWTTNGSKEKNEGDRRKFVETNKIGKTVQNYFGDIIKTVIIEQFIAINIYFKKQEISQIKKPNSIL